MQAPEGFDQTDEQRAVGELALKLHTNESPELHGELSSEQERSFLSNETEDYRIHENVVRFPTLEARNRVVAAHVFREKSAFPASESNWINVASDLWRHEIGKTDTATGRLLVLVHQRSDIFSMAATGIRAKSIDVFDALSAVECALPYLNRFPTDGIWDLCDAQYELTKNDWAGGMFFGKLGENLMRQPDDCRLLHRRLQAGTTDSTANIHPTVIMALAKSTPSGSEEAVRLTLADAESNNPILKGVALWTLGHLIVESFVSKQLMSAVCTVLSSNMSNPDDNVRRTAIHASALASRGTDAFVDALTKSAESGNRDALGSIADTLRRNRASMLAKPYFRNWVRVLCQTPPSEIGILEKFDHILSWLVSDEREQDFALSCLTEWVALNGTDTPRNETVSRLFNLTTIEIAKRPELLSRLITNWLLSDGTRIPAAAAGLLSYLGVHGLKKPEFDIAQLDALEEADLVFLARRLIGFVFSEDHGLSLAMSFFKTKNAQVRVFPFLGSLFVDEIGYDYPHSTIEALEAAHSVSSDAAHKDFYLQIIERIRNRMKALGDLPRLIELEPPPGLRRQLVRARAKQMNRAMEDARQESVIRRLVTEVPIKGGTGYFSFREGGYTEPGHLKSLSHSINLPRRVVLDTVGYELSLFMLRQASREES